MYASLQPFARRWSSQISFHVRRGPWLVTFYMKPPYVLFIVLHLCSLSGALVQKEGAKGVAERQKPESHTLIAVVIRIALIQQHVCIGSHLWQRSTLYTRSLYTFAKAAGDF